MPKYNLLNSNSKLAKLSGKKYLIAGLTIAPHSLGGVDVCPSAGACRAVCNLWFAGRTVTEPVRKAMLRRKELMFADPVKFRELLCDDVERFERNAIRKGLLPLLRPNVASDLDYSWLAREFPQVSFYDYTKVRGRLALAKRPNWPTNYHLTYSYSERSHHRTVGAWLDSGRNVAVVFSTDYNPQHHVIGKLPRTWHVDGCEREVVDGDAHDICLPEVDGRGVIRGLRFKGGRKRMAQAIRAGFVVDVG